MTWVCLAIVWILGATASRAVMAALAERNPRTYGDCFSGDDGLDMWLMLAWPIFWPGFAVYWLAYRAVAR